MCGVACTPILESALIQDPGVDVADAAADATAGQAAHVELAPQGGVVTLALLSSGSEEEGALLFLWA